MVLLLFGVGVILLAVAGAAFYYSARPRVSEHHLHIVAAQNLVRQGLPGESQPHFGGDVETTVEELGEHRYLVTGWVDVLTARGVYDRWSYYCKMHSSDDVMWVADEVNVLPQKL
jgi:hypothetical protein